MNSSLEEEFRRAMNWLSKGKNHQRDQVEGASGKFGYEQSNPIPANEDSYFRRLTCPQGHNYWYHRIGSMGEGPDGHIVDQIEMLCFGRESRIILYFDMYHQGSTSLVPDGLAAGTDLGIGSSHGR